MHVDLCTYVRTYVCSASSQRQASPRRPCRYRVRQSLRQFSAFPGSNEVGSCLLFVLSLAAQLLESDVELLQYFGRGARVVLGPRRESSATSSLLLLHGPDAIMSKGPRPHRPKASPSRHSCDLAAWTPALTHDARGVGPLQEVQSNSRPPALSSQP